MFQEWPSVMGNRNWSLILWFAFFSKIVLRCVLQSPKSPPKTELPLPTLVVCLMHPWLVFFLTHTHTLAPHLFHLPLSHLLSQIIHLLTAYTLHVRDRVEENNPVSQCQIKKPVPCNQLESISPKIFLLSTFKHILPLLSFQTLLSVAYISAFGVCL